MTDRDRLAADLETALLAEPVQQAIHQRIGKVADRLIALGWTRLDRIGACECSICDDRGVPCQNHSDICANCHRDCWGSVYPLDEERLARALLRVQYETGLEWEAVKRDAAAIAKAYREDAG